MAYLYILCEHQSEVDKYMAFRLLVYIVRAIELHRKKNPNVSLPLIYPLVVYSGVKPWNAPRDIYGLFGEEENIAKEVMFKPYQLIDLARLDEHEIKQHAWSGLAEFALKYRSAVRNVEAFCDVLFPWLKIIEQQDGESYCKIVLNYVINVLDIDDEKIFVQKVQEHLTGNLRGEAMTLAQWFEQKGIEKEKNIVAQRLLAEGCDFALIIKATGLSLETLIALQEKVH
ncbi:MAG TPA: Rpn family recombination-promoting nuclease/putative transposase [Gammaproteobacteria bacterium]|nr:Rpn family recombination-promoting nuclease/putative transposase [Gammaproteobacteria bacterium]